MPTEDESAFEPLQQPTLTKRKSRYCDEEGDYYQNRSKSTAPVNAPIAQVFEQIQVRMQQNKRRLSPGKLLIKHTQKMAKAEQVR